MEARRAFAEKRYDEVAKRESNANDQAQHLCKENFNLRRETEAAVYYAERRANAALVEHLNVCTQPIILYDSALLSEGVIQERDALRKEVEDLKRALQIEHENGMRMAVCAAEDVTKARSERDRAQKIVSHLQNWFDMRGYYHIYSRLIKEAISK